MIDNLPAEIALPLTALAWVGYLITLRVQYVREERTARALREPHGSEEVDRG